MYQVVLDTDVLVAALRSKRGASYRLLSLLGDGRWRPNVTVAVVPEYEAVLKCECLQFGLTQEDIDDVVGTICSESGLHRQYFLWRPVASDRVSVDRLVVAFANEGIEDWARVKARAERGSLEKLKRVLSKVRDVPADARDQL